jgi:hypothetical protein
MRVVETITAYGHPQIRATHPTTLEITKEKDVTPRGDCIIATRASKGAVDLSPSFKQLAAQPSTQITMTLTVNGCTLHVIGRGDLGLTFTHPTDLVARKSKYTCSRTLMVEADKAAADLPRSFVGVLRVAGVPVRIALVAEKRPK